MVELERRPTESGMRPVRTRVLWARMDPKERIAYIRTRGEEIFGKSGTISQKLLNKSGESSFANAVWRFYPDGLLGLKADLGIEVNKTPGYWTKGRIEEEAGFILKEHGSLSHKLLTRIERWDLQQAIIKYYPDGINALKRNLGTRVSDQVRKGYWTPERIEREAKKFVQREGSITVSLLDKKGKSNLGSAIVHSYPGGMSKLKDKLGIKGNKAKDFWNSERIETEAKKFVQKYGLLTKRLLDRNGRSDLRGAIAHNYPGGINALKEKLGIINAFSSHEANDYAKGLVE